MPSGKDNQSIEGMLKLKEEQPVSDKMATELVARMHFLSIINEVVT